MTTSELEKLEKALETWAGTHRYDLIIDTATKILAIDSHNKFATVHLLRAYNNTQKYETLSEAARVALENWPDWDVLYGYLYLFYLHLGGQDYIKARDAMVRAIKLNPNNAVWYRNLGEVYLINREPEKAERYLLESAKLSPDNAEFISRLAIAQIRLRKVKEGVDAIKKCLHDDPDNEKVLDNAGMAYILSGELEKAEELFRDALRRFPVYEYFQSHLDWVLREKRDKEMRLNKGLKYTPLYIRQSDRKRFFDEEQSGIK